MSREPPQQLESRSFVRVARETYFTVENIYEDIKIYRVAHTPLTLVTLPEWALVHLYPFHARHLGASLQGLELASDILRCMRLWVDSNT